MERDELDAYLSREADVIDSALIELRVDASVEGISVAGGSYVLYRLVLGRSTRLASLQSVLPDLAQRVSAHRRRGCRLRMREHPLGLEVDHPAPAALSWRGAKLGGRRPHSMLVGVEYADDKRTDVSLTFDEAAHILVAGTTGSGKSTVLRAMLTSLCWSTSPADLALFLIDLKNEDLCPYRDLPHCHAFAGSDRLASQAMAQVETELDRRIAGASASQRIVLVVDELAQLPDDAKQRLARILALGRSKRCNVVAATQHPTAKLVGEKSNYSVRLIGRVTDAATSALCTGRPGAGCEMLPGRGSFVLVDGADLRRVQAYSFGADIAPGLVRILAQRWPSDPEATHRSKTGYEPVSEHCSEQKTASTAVAHQCTRVRTSVADSMWPLPMRPPTEDERIAIRELAGRMSLNKVVALVYGSKSGKTHGWVKGALQ